MISGRTAGAAVTLLAVLASYWGVYEHGRRVERADGLVASSRRDSGDRLAELLGERGARQEEQRRAQAQEEARANAQKEQKAATSDAAGADAAGQRLQHDAAQLAASVSCPGQDTAALARGASATRAAMVLSELLERSVATNRELAKAYDEARIAGLACEASYDSLTGGG